MVLFDLVLAVGLGFGAIYTIAITRMARTTAVTAIAAATGLGCIASSYTQLNNVIGGLPEVPAVILTPLLVASVLGWVALISPQLRRYEYAAHD